MEEHEYPSFDAEIINQSLAAAREHDKAAGAEAVATHESQLAEGPLKISAQCIGVTIRNHKACLNLPFHIGNVCLPIPSWVPQGSVARACLDICTKFGIPCGIEVTIYVGGQRIIRKGFGCSC